MQIDILGNAAIVSVKIAVIPLITAVILARAIRPTVITTNGQDIPTSFYIRCQVESTCHHTILTIA